MVKFSLANVQETVTAVVSGTLRLKCEPLKKLRRTKRNAARTRINSTTRCSQSFVGSGLSIRSWSRRTTMLFRVTRF